MLQIQRCLDRYFEGKPPLKGKWQVSGLEEYPNILLLFHYQHLVLVFNANTHEVIYQWWEVPADKRGLDSALEYLTDMNGDLGAN